MSWWNEAWSRIAGRQVASATQLRIPDDHVVGAGAPVTLLPETDYFGIKVNEFRLGADRKLWQSFRPSVWTSVDFTYARERRTIPFVIGPGLLGQPADGVPDDTVFRDVDVMGPVPYRGGPINVSLVVSQVATDNGAADLLSVVESTGKALGLSAGLAPYLSIGHCIADGIQAMLRLGSRPLTGVRDTVDPGAADAAESRTGWYALLDEALDEPLWVVDRSLRVGASADSARPVSGHGYVLYSVYALPRDAGRNDAASLPDLAEARDVIERMAERADPKSWRVTKVLFGELAAHLKRHPDLTRAHATALMNAWWDELLAAHEAAIRRSHLGGAHGAPDRDLDEVSNVVLQIVGQ